MFRLGKLNMSCSWEGLRCWSVVLAFILHRTGEECNEHHDIVGLIGHDIVNVIGHDIVSVIGHDIVSVIGYCIGPWCTISLTTLSSRLCFPRCFPYVSLMFPSYISPTTASPRQSSPALYPQSIYHNTLLQVVDKIVKFSTKGLLKILIVGCL